MPRGRVKTSNKVRASISISTVREMMAELERFKDQVHLEDEEIDPALVGEVIETFAIIGLHSIRTLKYAAIHQPIPAQLQPLLKVKDEASSQPIMDDSILDEMDDDE
jgi:hypothetical protein